MEPRSEWNIQDVMVTHKWEGLWIPGICLNEEFIAPALQGLETFRVIDVVNQNTAIGTTIESHAE